MPHVSYPLTGQFPWSWFAPALYSFAFLSLVILCIVNVALTGYETVTVFRSEFNAEQRFWFSRFVRKKTHENCSPQVFKVGDSLTTNYSIFDYQLDSVSVPNAGSSGLSYNGAPLTGCDLQTLYGTGDLRSWTSDFKAQILCKNGTDYEITASTSFSRSYLAGSINNLFGISSAKNIRAGLVEELMQNATSDAAIRSIRALQGSNGTYYVLVSYQVDFELCPAFKGPSASCATDVPRFNISSSTIVYPDSTFFINTLDDPTTPWVLDRNILSPLNNIIRIIQAAVRVDLGNPIPNNFLLYPNLAKSQLITSFPHSPTSPTDALSTSMLADWVQNPTLSNSNQLNVPGPASLEVVYLCQIQQQKAPGQLFISVLVATLSMFSSGWAAIIGLAAFIGRRTNSTSNVCMGHCEQWHTVEDPSYKFSTDTFKLRRRVVENKEYDPVAVEQIQRAAFESPT